MSNPSPAEYHIVTPPAHEGLAFRFLRGSDFQIAEIPQDEVDLSNPTSFLPILIAVTAYGPAVFSVGARPAYDDGAVSQWLEYLCRKDSFECGALREVRLGNYRAVECEAMQTNDGVTMHMRMALIEEGGRLYSLTAMAPEPLWSTFGPILDGMLRSFDLAQDRGQKVPLWPGAEAPSTDAADPWASAPVMPASEAVLSPADLNELVLAEDAASLSPDHPMNVNLRESGNGFSAKVFSIDAEQRTAMVATSSIMGAFAVPFGWHVMDDGRRTLIFDAGGKIQINLGFRSTNGQPLERLLDLALADCQAEQADVPHVRLRLGEFPCLALRNLKVGDEVLEQAFMARPWGAKPEYALVARITAGNSDDMRRAMNLAGSIVGGLRQLEEVAAS